MLRFEGFPDAKWIAEINEETPKLLAKLHGFKCPIHAKRVLRGIKPIVPELSADTLRMLLAPGMTVDLKTTMRTRAGAAWYKRKLIALNYRLLAANPGEMIKTYTHELAHIIAGLLYGPSVGHGPEWKAIAIAMGDDGGRCHTMDTSAYKSKRTKYPWVCDCREYTFGAVRDKRAKANLSVRGRSGFHCRSCKTPLIPREIK